MLPCRYAPGKPAHPERCRHTPGTHRIQQERSPCGFVLCTVVELESNMMQHGMDSNILQHGNMRKMDFLTTRTTAVVK